MINLKNIHHEREREYINGHISAAISMAPKEVSDHFKIHPPAGRYYPVKSAYSACELVINYLSGYTYEDFCTFHPALDREHIQAIEKIGDLVIAMWQKENPITTDKGKNHD